MAFADPQSITINAVANSLPRVSVGQNVSSYQKDDGTVSLTASHQYGKRTRRMIRVDHQKIVPDQMVTANNIKVGMSAYLVVETPPTGNYTVAEAKQIVDGLLAYLTASSGARITQLLGGEN